MYFSKKGIRSVQWGLDQSPRRWGIFENFCVKSNLTLYIFTFDCKLQKKIGGALASCSPIILLGSKCSPCCPGSLTYDSELSFSYMT